MTTSNEPRKLPTRPGWWWYHDPSSPHGVCVYVGKSTITGQMILDTTEGIMAADEIAGEWIAPIPSPAVLVALAEYAEAVLQRGPRQGNVNVSDALLALDVAIIAERATTEGVTQ